MRTRAWQWYRPDAEGTAAVESMAPFIAPGGEVLVAVVLTGSGEPMLDWVRIGANVPPLAVFTADKTTGFAPLAVRPGISPAALAAVGVPISHRQIS